jgi:hypothetical protein
VPFGCPPAQRLPSRRQARGRPAPQKRLAGRPRRARRARRTALFPTTTRGEPLGASGGRARFPGSFDGSIAGHLDTHLDHVGTRIGTMWASAVTGTPPSSGHGEELLQGAMDREASDVRDLRRRGGRGAGGAPSDPRGVGLAVRSASQRRVPAPRAGRDFVASLHAVWRAAGIRSKRHEAALSAHLARIRRRPDRNQPGSYSWPGLRQEAERRFARGEHPRVVIDDLRRRHTGLPANVPSVRTMRRWFAQRRWLTSVAASAHRAGRVVGTGPTGGLPRAPRAWRPIPPGRPRDDPGQRGLPRSRAPSGLT